jgi:hypothetical protein
LGTIRRIFKNKKYMLTKKCGPGKIGYWLEDRNRFLFNIFFGIKSRIPICCVIEWSIRSYFYNPDKDKPIAIAVGCWNGYYDEGTRFRPNEHPDYVHCWIHRNIYKHV